MTAATDLLVVAASPEHLAHPTDYLDAVSTVVMRGSGSSWPPPRRAPRARASARPCTYWLATELPHVSHLIDLVRSDETSFTALAPDDF